MFKFIFQLIDLFFTFYPRKALPLKLLSNYFQNKTCTTRRSLCFSTFFAAVSPPWSFLYSTPWTAISNFILLSFILFSWHCLDFNDLKVILFLYSSVHIVVHVHSNVFVITLRNLLRSLVGIRINSSWQKDKDYVETFIEFFSANTYKTLLIMRVNRNLATYCAYSFVTSFVIEICSVVLYLFYTKRFQRDIGIFFTTAPEKRIFCSITRMKAITIMSSHHRGRHDQ